MVDYGSECVKSNRMTHISLRTEQALLKKAATNLLVSVLWAFLTVSLPLPLSLSIRVL